MGDRANIVVVNHRHGSEGQKPPLVYLYTHWSGSELPEILRLALSRNLRWDDEQYLARIIFDQMTAGSQGEETGFGISAALRDNSYPLLVVDCAKQTVGLAMEGKEPDCYRSWSFQDYVDQEQATWPDERIMFISE